MLFTCACALLPRLALAVPIIKAGDRMVIYGDSITEQRQYSRFVQQYFYCRYPDMKLKVYNAGWGGDRASGALNRLERDVLVLKPTIVTLFFGMNDGNYSALNDGTLAEYRKNLEGLITTLQGKGIRVVVFTPGCVDPDRQPRLKEQNYNAMLEAMGKAALELAKQYNCPSADVHHPMLAFQNARKAEAPGYTMIPDSVHPDGNGHLVMANAMLSAFGVEPMPALGTVDVKANTADGLRMVTNTHDKIELETTPPATPFWFDASSLSTMRLSGFLELAGQKLTVSGLPEVSYRLTVNNMDLGRVSAESLAAGVFIPGTYSARGRILQDLVARKENNYFSAWREVRLPLADLTAAKAVVEGMMSVDDAFHAAIYELATPTEKVAITLEPVPENASIAEGAPYVCSDPNIYNYGSGGLTDGSWSNEPPHCFATNDTDKFPKDVTIDLGAAKAIASIVAGVPPFGSTKTIAVAVSADGKTFTEVGTHVFFQNKEERFTYTFDATTARYVRLTYPDHYAEAVRYPNTFCFTAEVEVYPPAKPAPAK